MNRTVRRLPLVALVMAGTLAAAMPAAADPPSRVARLNYLKGSVSLRPATLDDWGPATVNYPLTTGDHLWTDAESWAEMHVGSTAIRLAPHTAFAFLNLDDSMVQLRLSEGALDVRVRNLEGGDGFEINTPSAAIVLTRPGIYRVDVLPDGADTRVTVREGSAEVIGENSSFWVHAGQAAAITGTGYVSHEVFGAGPPDDWERWCRARDQREDRAVALRYVSHEMTGYEDLDEYGTWRSVPEYGWAWQPTRVAVGWAPYRHGHWRWIEPWGWSWIDDAPWGFAPFHYGRWACLRGTWLWVPGAYVRRPVYAPALVAFIGGSRWGVSFGLGYRDTLAWFPLAPGEMWMPHYRASHGYIRNLNITNVRVTNININNYHVSNGTYVNRAIGGAVTAVPRDAFIGGRAVPRYAIAVDGRSAMNAEVVGMSATVAPRADSIIGPSTAGARRPRAASLTRAVVARTEPPAPPVPFRARERALQADAGRPLDDGTVETLRRRGETTGAGPVRLAGARAVRRGDGERADVADDNAPRAAESQPTYSGLGTARGRDGVRSRPGTMDAGRPGSPASASPAERTGAGINDRPGWAQPRGEGTRVAPANPGDWGSGQARPRAGERVQPGQVEPDRRPGAARERPTYGGENVRPAWSGGESRPSGPGGARERSGADRPQPGSDQGRPSWGGSESRPSWGGGESRPSAPGGARERSGGDRPQPGSDQGRPSWGGSEPRPAPPAGARERSGGERSQPPSAGAPAPRGGDRPSGGTAGARGGDRPSGGTAGARGGDRQSGRPAGARPPGGARNPGGSKGN